MALYQLVQKGARQMEDSALNLQKSDIRALLSAGSGDAALCWLYLQSGGNPEGMATALNLPEAAVSRAMALLRQLGLVSDRRIYLRPAEPPLYSEAQILELAKEQAFRDLEDEVWHILGKPMGLEGDRVLINIRSYLGLPDDIIPLLVSYCRDRARARGNMNPISMRVIEKEAYYWADNGIDSFEEAQAFLQKEANRRSKLGAARKALQIYDRRLSPTEEQYILKWLEMGFGEAEIALAYDKSCTHTGGLSWPYMNSIFKSWQKQQLFTLEQIQEYDKPGQKPYTQGKNPKANEAGPDPIMVKALEAQRKRIARKDG